MFEYQTLFDARGALYNRANRLFPEARAEEARRMLAHLEPRPAGPWLDVSSGGGYLSQRAVADGLAPARFACDASLHFLCVSGALPGSSVAAAENLPFANATFAGAACLAALHHAEEPESVVRELMRVTCRHGRAALGDVAADSEASEFLNGFVHGHTDAGHQGKFPDPDSLALLFRASGGEAIRVERTSIAWTFAGRAEAVTFCRDLFGLRPATSDAAIAEALGVLGAREGAGAFRVPWTMLYVSAERA